MRSISQTGLSDAVTDEVVVLDKDQVHSPLASVVELKNEQCRIILSENFVSPTRPSDFSFFSFNPASAATYVTKTSASSLSVDHHDSFSRSSPRPDHISLVMDCVEPSMCPTHSRGLCPFPPGYWGECVSFVFVGHGGYRNGLLLSINLYSLYVRHAFRPHLVSVLTSLKVASDCCGIISSYVNESFDCSRLVSTPNIFFN